MKRVLLMFTIFIAWILLIVLLGIKVPIFYVMINCFIAGMKIGDWAYRSYKFLAKKIFKEN